MRISDWSSDVCSSDLSKAKPSTRNEGSQVAAALEELQGVLPVGHAERLGALQAAADHLDRRILPGLLSGQAPGGEVPLGLHQRRSLVVAEAAGTIRRPRLAARNAVPWTTL